MIRTLIIDDEHDAREALRLTLEKYCPEITVLKVCHSAQEGLESIQKLAPDLIFLDVQMPYMTGFDLLKQCSQINFEVIFISAYDQYAIKAIRFSALDYLLKPVDVDDLMNAVSRAKERMHQKNNSFQYQSMLNNVQYKQEKIEKLAVPSLEGIDFFNVDDIIFCEADGSYTRLFLPDRKQKLVSRNLKDFESMLESSGFCRVHNSFLINMKHVHKYLKGEGGTAVLSEGHHVDISRRKKEVFLNLLDKL
jgi:two-component system LytT family response regulator